MSIGQTVRAVVTGDSVLAWLAVGLRAVSVAALVPAGLLKLVDYGPQATRFAELGVPAADVMVVFVGIVELVTALAVGLGVLTRVAAFVNSLVMLAAIAFVGVVASNAVVLLASLGIVVLGPGRYAVWNPETELLGQRLSAGEQSF